MCITNSDAPKISFVVGNISTTVKKRNNFTNTNTGKSDAKPNQFLSGRIVTATAAAASKKHKTT